MSYKGWRVIAWTPYGREIVASILAAYLKRDHDAGILDEWYVCMNTGRNSGANDILWAQQLAEREDWITLQPVPGTVPWKGKYLIPSSWRGPDTRGPEWDIHKFWAYMTNTRTIYLRLDDDIVYLHENAVTRLADATIDGVNDSILASFPVIINNAVVAWHQQQQHKIPTEFGAVNDPNCLADTSNGLPAYKDLRFAMGIHEYALDSIEAGAADLLMLDAPVILPASRFSISAFTHCGSALDGIGGLVETDEEVWLSAGHPQRTGMRNQIVPKALVSHFSFHPVWPQMQQTPILGRYRALAEAL